MSTHDLSGGGDVLDRVTRFAQRAALAYGCAPASTVRLLNVSENATYLVEHPDQGPCVLRVHRLGYHTGAEIESELAWMDALRAEAGVRTPRVLPAPDGQRVLALPDAGRRAAALRALRVPAGHRARRRRRHATSPSWARSPRGCTSTPASGPGRPGSPGSAGTTRRRSARSPAGDGGRTASASARPSGTCSAGLAGALGGRLARFGTGPGRFGLVHADTRLANLLVDGGRVSVIDFDDSGFSWFLYDVGTAVSFFEHQPHVPELVDSWLSGYRRVLSLPAEDEAEIWTFIMFRRLLLVAWIGSHQAAEIARQLGAGYTQDSCDLAERFLSRGGKE